MNPKHLSIGIAIAPDGASVGCVTAEVWLGAPVRIVTLERVGVAAGPRDLVRWFDGRAGDIRAWGLHEPRLRERRHVLVETGHYTLGKPVFEALWYSDARRKWEPRLSAVELVGVDLAIPQRDGWRTKVSRREVVSALRLAMEHGGLEFAPVDRGLAIELRGQLEKLTQWRERDNPDGSGGELAIAQALAVWDAARVQRRLEIEQPRRTA